MNAKEKYKHLSDDLIKQELEKALLRDDEFNRNEFPYAWNLSSAHFYKQLPVPKVRERPEFIFLRDYKVDRDIEQEVTISEWNMAWEVGHLRGSFFWDRLPKNLLWLRDYDGVNLYLVPANARTPYQTYAPFLHLLPLNTRLKFGLPLMKKGHWPFITDSDQLVLDHVIKSNFLQRLSKAFAYHVWPLLDSQSKTFDFAGDESLVLLAHNLNFWMPFLYDAIEERLSSFERVQPEDRKQLDQIKSLQLQYPEIDVKLPLMGGPIWIGEDEAWDTTKQIVEKADSNGKLRSIIDSIKSNRVEDDFSDRWSYAKEDFERKLYSKRSKVQVRFVELDDAIPIHSPSSEIEENLLWDDLLSVVNTREKKVVVCLRKGMTNHKEISEILGYKNHTPVTKLLGKIRAKVAKIL